MLALAAALGFLTALYTARRDIFAELTRLLGAEPSLLAKIAAGMALAILGPLVGGLAHAASGARWMTEFFGILGDWYWAWVAKRFVAKGLSLAMRCRTSPPGVGVELLFCSDIAGNVFNFRSDTMAFTKANTGGKSLCPCAEHESDIKIMRVELRQMQQR